MNVTLAVADERDTAAAVAALAAHEGTRGHSWPRHLLASEAHRLDPAPDTRRVDLADAVHALCVVHGTRPGAADAAAARLGDPWADAAALGFAAERALLTRLAAAAGPLPSTPGQAATAAALEGQRRALWVMASSERAGCGAGLLAALALDWIAVRGVLAAAAQAWGERIDPPSLGTTRGLGDALDRAEAAGASPRAVMFGAQQLLAQQRGLWSLLEARAGARRAG